MGGYIISATNLLIHTPMLHELSEQLPEWIVTTCSHTEHHRVLSAHYAATTLNIDYFVAKIRGVPYSRKGKKFPAQVDTPAQINNAEVMKESAKDKISFRKVSVFHFD